MKAIKKTTNIFFVIWTSCAIANANCLKIEETISCDPVKKQTFINSEDNSTQYIDSTAQTHTPIWFLDLFKLKATIEEQKKRVIEIVTIEG